MSLLINTCDMSKNSSYRAVIGKTNSRKWKLDYPLETLQDCLQVLPESRRQTILSLATRDRTYIKKLGREEDSHLDLEKLGIGEHCKNYTMIISLEESIDYVFYALMGTPIEAVRSLPNYKQFSHSLITLDLPNIKTTYEELMGIHPTIEKYVLTEALAFSENVPIDSDNFNQSFSTHLLKNISYKVEEILNSIVCNLFYAYEKQYVLRSRGCGIYILSTDNPTSMEVMLSTGESQIYMLKLKAYSKLAYLFEVEGQPAVGR